MEWKHFLFDGNLQNYIDDCRRMAMELESVDKKVPNDLLSFSLLGKIGGDCELHHFADGLTLNEELIEKPDLILTRLQDYSSIHKERILSTEGNTCALVTTTNNEPHKIVYYCRNGKHNKKCTNHKKEDCWEENPHPRPNKKENKRKYYNNSVHFTKAQALMMVIQLQKPKMNQLIFDCGAKHHMFNHLSLFTIKP
ncbi:hypothetical protein O181_098063 [Austropuccinia psidii MF-1]|uniref:Uncharacterized protein n=1 Tax=Austropuccinia psidii MF-1 TaxID=1389203 RepID=A0A9Q3PDS4_9BASI|nr:hypothetical protein [Austropuccinia psidii MF-1]